MKILLGTKNHGKILEFKSLFKDSGFTLVTLDDIYMNKTFEEPAETGKTYKENALIKAKTYYQYAKIPCLSDDSGLEVDILDGRPGIESARYGEKNFDDRMRFNKLLEELSGKTPTKAHFHDTLVFYDGESVIVGEGDVEGQIIDQPKGNEGFGYDPIFYLEEFKKTMSELSNEEKNQISHRSKAVQAILPKLQHWKSIRSHLDALENKIIEMTKDIYQTQDVSIVNRLSGGMSNYTYVISVNGNKKVFRLPGERAEKYVDREIEKANLKIIESIMDVPKTEYFDVESGVKITPYVEGISLHMTDDYDYVQIAKVLKELHNSGKLAINDYDPFGRLETYEKYSDEFHYQHSDYYYEVKKKLYQFKDYLDSLPKVLCHGDAQRSNYIKTNDGILLVDHEFVGNNDYYYDIASFGNREQNETGFGLLDCYLGHKATDEDIDRYLLWHAFQDLQWYTVATYKHLIGLGKTLGIDFEAVANYYLHDCDETLNQVIFRKNSKKNEK